ncbi:MAG: endonuclease III [Alistipes sp.]|nr:endonuclease III [Candidatus Alistipes equi]
MTKKERYQGCIEYFQKVMPEAKSELNFSNPFELLVAVILSAQCTDKRVNLTTPALFKAYPSAREMSLATQEEIYQYIKSISYPHNKSKHLCEMSKKLCECFNAEVPSSIESLMELPGVGRKTANVVGAVIWNKQVMPVDTHVFRVAKRIGLAPKRATIRGVETELEKNFPKEMLPIAHHWLILHGRYICTARNAKCTKCGLELLCKEYSSRQKKSSEEEVKA